MVSGERLLVDHVEVSAGGAELSQQVQGRPVGEPAVDPGHLHGLPHEVVQHVDGHLQLLVDGVPVNGLVTKLTVVIWYNILVIKVLMYVCMYEYI